MFSASGPSNEWCHLMKVYERGVKLNKLDQKLFKGGFVVENARIVEYIPIFHCY